MKKQLLITGLMMGLTGVYAGAQVSGSPSTQDPNQTAPQSPSQGPGATTPGMQPTFPADQKAPQSPTEQQSGQPPADQTSSSQVQSDLQKAFQGDSALAQSSVSAQVIENKIVLTGTVQSQADKDKAEQIANQVGG